MQTDYAAGGKPPPARRLAKFFGGRWGVAALLLAAAAAAFFAPWGGVWALFVLAASAAAAFEWGRLLGYSAAAAGLYAALFLLFAAAGEALPPAELIFSFYLWWGALLFWIFAAPCLLLGGAPPLAGGRGGVWLGALGLLALYAAWRAAVALHDHDREALLAGLAAVWLFDSAAFFVGKQIGKTPLAPNISPKKTMEGLLGGAFAVLAAALCYALWGQPSLRPSLLLAAAFSLAALATLGDLFESWLKRRAGVKDSGGLLGAHGGALDRFDALLPALPFVALLSSS